MAAVSSQTVFIQVAESAKSTLYCVRVVSPVTKGAGRPSGVGRRRAPGARVFGIMQRMVKRALWLRKRKPDGL